MWEGERKSLKGLEVLEHGYINVEDQGVYLLLKVEEITSSGTF